MSSRRGVASSTFLLTLPVSTGTFVRVKLCLAAQLVALTWLGVFAVGLLWAVISGRIYDMTDRLLEFSGITAATPNEAEVEEALRLRVGQDWRKLVDAGDEVVRRLKLESLVVTRGRDGMVAFTRRHKPVDIPSFGSDEVTDVTGAGDTVIATFTAALAAGASTEEAAHLANYAGGIVVMKRGTATVSRAELLHALEQAPPATRSH